MHRLSRTLMIMALFLTSRPGSISLICSSSEQLRMDSSKISTGESLPCYIGNYPPICGRISRLTYAVVHSFNSIYLTVSDFDSTLSSKPYRAIFDLMAEYPLEDRYHC